MQELLKFFTASLLGSIIGPIISSIGSVFVKKIERQGDINKIKKIEIEKKKIVLYEFVYSKLLNMSSVNSTGESVQLELIEIEKYINDNNLYFGERMISIISRFNDYFKDFINGESRDLNVEESFLKEFKVEFNK